MILLDPGPPTGERSGGCGERGGHLSVFWGPARVLQVPVRLAYFAHLLDVVQEEKPRARTRRWPEEEAPSIGGSDGRDGHEGFFRHPLGWHPLGRASAGGPEMPDGRPPGLYSRRVGFKCGTWSFFRLGEASVRASVAAARCPGPPPWAEILVLSTDRGAIDDLLLHLELSVVPSAKPRAPRLRARGAREQSYTPFGRLRRPVLHIATGPPSGNPLTIGERIDRPGLAT